MSEKQKRGNTLRLLVGVFHSELKESVVTHQNTSFCTYELLFTFKSLPKVDDRR